MTAKPKDVVLVHAPTPDGKGVNVLRARDERLEAGTLRPMEEGKPLHGEVVKLTPRPEFPLLFDVETQFSAPEQKVSSSSAPAAARSAGPPKVATDTYRRGWDAIWKRPPGRGSAVN